MIDSVTVLRKELLELVADRHSIRGPLTQAFVVITFAGVIVPAVNAEIWRNASALAILYVLFPAFLAAVVAADAFAGERERKTIETLLATRLHDGSIFVGKTAMAVGFAVTLSIVAFTVAMVTTSLRTGAIFTPPPALVLYILLGSFGAALLTGSIAIALSARVAVARSAQQLASISAMMIASVLLLGLRLLAPFSWLELIRVELALIAFGGAILAIAMRLFRRDRFFEDR